MKEGWGKWDRFIDRALDVFMLTGIATMIAVLITLVVIAVKVVIA